VKISLIGWRNAWPPLVVAIVLLALTIGLSSALHPSGVAFLGVILWLLALGSVAVAAYLVLVCSRPIAAVGALVTGIAILTAFYTAPQPWLLWTTLFFIGVGLIAFDTRHDVPDRGAWPLLLLRVFIGWSWVDNAQDHFWNGQWFGGTGGQFLQTLNGVAGRTPLQPLDPLYQGFIRGAMVPNPDLWAALTACGELTFGLLLAIGFATPIAAFLATWQSSNYILEKGFIAHGAYTDKAFLAAQVALLVTQAGLAYGLDAALRRHVPAWFARWLLGTQPTQSSPSASPALQPRPRPAQVG
jgi:uncharacterized membrane protein YphA (DoxX/SURF4 family)